MSRSFALLVRWTPSINAPETKQKLRDHDADAVAAMTEEALILSGSEAALGAGEYDRARMLLALAFRVDSHMETLRLDAALGRRGHEPTAPANPPLLARLLRQWGTLAPPVQREPTMRGCSERRFALAPQAEGSAAPEHCQSAHDYNCPRGHPQLWRRTRLLKAVAGPE